MFSKMGRCLIRDENEFHPKAVKSRHGKVVNCPSLRERDSLEQLPLLRAERAVLVAMSTAGALFISGPSAFMMRSQS